MAQPATPAEHRIPDTLRRIDLGQWRRVYRGVFKVGANPPSTHERELAALLAIGPSAVLSHESAAKKLWLETRNNHRIQISIPHDMSASGLEGVQVTRSRDLLPEDVTVRGPFRMTRVGRTLVDLASVLDDEWLRATIDSAIRQRGSNLYWIRHAYQQHAAGRERARRLEALLARYESPKDVGASVLESFAMELGLATGRKPIWHYLVTDGGRFNAEVDFAWPDIRLAVELDGWRYHGSFDAFQNDRARDRALGDLGWTVRRFTWHDVTRDRQAFINALERAHRQCRERAALERERAPASPEQSL